ncbi:hypothetical protein AB9F43_32845, partial [Rhizobium leguminosarum]
IRHADELRRHDAAGRARWIAHQVLELDGENRARLFSSLDEPVRIAIQHLMGYPPRTAGGSMATGFVSGPDSWTVARTLDQVRQVERARETVYAMYV